MADILTHAGIGTNVSPLTRDMIQFMSSRSYSITNAEILANSDDYRALSADMNMILQQIKEAAVNNKELVKKLENLEDAIRGQEYEARYYIYKRGYQDALKSLFCLMAG